LNISTADGAAWRAKDVEHPALVVGREMKEAVPGEDPVELAGELQRPHVPEQPRVAGETLAAQRKQRRRRVDARHPEPACRHVERDRSTRTAAQVQHACAARQRGDETVVPGPIIPPCRTPVGIPCARVALVMLDDPVGELAHPRGHARAI
jgi:hypothetical protein